MKKFLLAILTLFIIVLASCGIGPNQEDVDSIPFEEYKTLVIENTNYKVFKTEKIKDSLDYVYYDMDISSNKYEWIVNTNVDLEYKTSNHYKASDLLLEEVYINIGNDEILNDLDFSYDIKRSNYYDIEEMILNTELENIKCGVFITYIRFLIKTDSDRFYLDIPIFERILKTNSDNIIDPFTNLYISKESFREKYL